MPRNPCGNTSFSGLPPLGSAAAARRMVVRTESHVVTEGPIDTRITDFSPVSPIAGPLQACGGGVGRRQPGRSVDVDGLILNTPFPGPMSVGENPVAFSARSWTAIETAVVRGVVLRINSPGGGVAACLAMRHDLGEFRPAPASRSSPALDTACRRGVLPGVGFDRSLPGKPASPAAIGVILNLFNLQDLIAQFNVIPQPIKAGEKADIGSSAKAAQPGGDRQILQWMADEFNAQLIADIRRHRPNLKAARARDLRWPHFHGDSGQGSRPRRSDRRHGCGNYPGCIARLPGQHGQAAGRALSPQQRSGPFHLCRLGEHPAARGAGCCRTCPASTAPSCRPSCPHGNPN